jgi:endonuclease YncB( thermonuclease family)
MVKLSVPSVCLMTLCLIWPPQSGTAGEPVLIGTANVIDGDTIVIAGQRIRIMDVDAPESAQNCTSADQSDWPCGVAAAGALATMVKNKRVSCRAVGRPSRGLQLARCAAEGVDVANWILAAGWAVPAQHCKCEIARELANRAESAGHGIWGSTFQLPWDWRASR